MPARAIGQLTTAMRSVTKALLGLSCAALVFPAFATDIQALEERLAQLEKRVIQNEKWLEGVAPAATGHEKSWTMSDVTSSGLTVVKTYYGHIAYSLADIKPFGSGAEVTVKVINMQSTGFTDLEVVLHVANASIFGPVGQKRKEEVVTSTIPVAKGGVAVMHKIKVKMPASDIKEWGLMISDWGGLTFSRGE